MLFAIPFLAAAALIILYSIWNKPQDSVINKVRSASFIENNKVVVIKATAKDFSKAINEFLVLNNVASYVALPRMYTVSESTYVVTFPYNISFKLFCEFIEFMTQPTSLQKQLDVTGWATQSENEEWVEPGFIGKNCLFFVAENGDFPMVYITTDDNIGYKVSFDFDEAEKLDFPKVSYTQPNYSTESLSGYPFKDLE